MCYSRKKHIKLLQLCSSDLVYVFMTRVNTGFVVGINTFCFELSVKISVLRSGLTFILSTRRNHVASVSGSPKSYDGSKVQQVATCPGRRILMYNGCWILGPAHYVNVSTFPEIIYRALSAHSEAYHIRIFFF